MVSNTRPGRPRSDAAQLAVLHAIDDLVAEIGYSAMTMKNIADRAGVSRQTIYRWWSTKAEILAEATSFDARKALTITPSGDRPTDLIAYLSALARFLTVDDSGIGYRALLGEAQHDRAVAELLDQHDALTDSARAILGDDATDLAVARLVGPTLFWIMRGGSADDLDPAQLAASYLSGE